MESFSSAGQLKESEIQERFIRSAGPGGQNVNKVATCVVLIHRPTDIQIKCQENRSQYENRLRARELLVIELKRRDQEERLRLISEREKVRRKNRPKPRGLKKKILEFKRKHAKKKALRKPVRED